MTPHTTRAQAEAAKQAARELVRRLDKRAAVGLTRVRGEFAVKVNLSAPLAKGAVIPEAIDGVPIKVEVTGHIRPR